MLIDFHKSLVLLATARRYFLYIHTHTQVCNAQRRYINSKDAKV